MRIEPADIPGDDAAQDPEDRSLTVSPRPGEQ